MLVESYVNNVDVNGPFFASHRVASRRIGLCACDVNGPICFGVASGCAPQVERSIYRSCRFACLRSEC